MGFLDYLDDFEKNAGKKSKKTKQPIEEKKKIVKKVVKENKKPVKKKFRIKKKQVIKNKLDEMRDHAFDILDGLPDIPDSFEVTISETQGLSQEQLYEMQQKQQQLDINSLDLNNTEDHAAALL